MKKYRLCWFRKSWDRFNGIPCCTTHNSIEEIIAIMSKCIYNGEWIEDYNGKKVDIELRDYALS